MSSGLVRTGRGGAGNFLNQEDVKEAEEAQHANDPESQSSSAPPVVGVPASQAPQYVRSGRGGAGNFADPPTRAESQAREDVVDRTEVAVHASQAGKPRTTGLSGRGGAGNWTDSSSEEAKGGGGGGDADDDVRSRQTQIEDKIVHDIEASLPPPPRTYHQHDRDMEK